MYTLTVTFSNSFTSAIIRAMKSFAVFSCFLAKDICVDSVSNAGT